MTGIEYINIKIEYIGNNKHSQLKNDICLHTLEANDIYRKLTILK